LRRRHGVILLSLAAGLSILFSLFDAPSLNFSSAPLLGEASSLLSPVERAMEVRVRVVHLIDNGPPRPPRLGLAFVILGGQVAELNARGEAEFHLTPGNYSLGVYWRDGVLFPFRSIVAVDKPLLIIVTFREVRILPTSLSLSVNYTTGSTSIELQYTPPKEDYMYGSTPIITTLSLEGRLRVYPTHERLDDHLTPRPYYLGLSLSAGYALYDVIIPLQSTTSIIVPWVVLSVIDDETFIPVQITNATIVEGDIDGV